jgi:hypothetical protein
MRLMHPWTAIVLSSLLCFAGCDQSAQAPLPASPSPPSVPRPVPSPSPANPAVLVVKVYPGAPCLDADRCPPDTIVPNDPDGGYTLPPGTPYSAWIYVTLSPAGCLSGYHVFDSWDSKSEHGSRCDFPELYEGTAVDFGFLTPQSSSSMTPDHQITVIVETVSATARKEIPIRLSQNP